LFVNYDYFALGDLPVVDFEGRPPERLKIVKSMLVQLREVKKLLREAIGLAALASLVKKLLEALVLSGDIS
jgi:hypothetical protein